MKPKRRPLTRYAKKISVIELRRLLHYFQKRCYKVYLLCCLLTLGLRVGEVVRLKKENFNHDFTEINYELEKSGRIHTRLIPRKLATKLKKHAAHLPQNKARFLFQPNKSGRRHEHLSVPSVEKWFKEARAALDLEQEYWVYTRADGKQRCLKCITPHTLRHFACTCIYDATGHDIVAVADIIGHLNPETTMKYYLANRKEREHEVMGHFNKLF